MGAAYCGDVAMARELVKLGAQGTLTNDTGWTALHSCAKSDVASAAMVATFLVNEAAAPVDIRENDGLTPLNVAAQFGSDLVVCVLELIIEILLPTTPGTMLPCGTVQHRPGHTTQYTKYYFLQRSFHPAIGFLLLPLH